jgi:hypothetical protein
MISPYDTHDWPPPAVANADARKPPRRRAAARDCGLRGVRTTPAAVASRHARALRRVLVLDLIVRKVRARAGISSAFASAGITEAPRPECDDPRADGGAPAD